MRNVSKILVALFTVLTLSCAKDGETGPQGPAGVDGIDGNANVTIYNFETDFILTTSKSLVIPGLSQGKVDSSMLLCYYKDAASLPDLWYISPGLGRSSNYQTRYYTTSSSTSTTLNLFILDADGTAYSGVNVTISQVKIIVVPATTVINLRIKKPLTEMSYEEVCRLFNIKEDNK
jgi:hypothetical protein